MSIRCLLGIHAFQGYRLYNSLGFLSYCKRCSEPRWT